jgi:hypothetical protein
MDLNFTKKSATITIIVIVIVIALVLIFTLGGFKSNPSASSVGTGVTATTTKYVPPITNTPAAASQVAKNDGVFAEEDVAMTTLQLMDGSTTLNQALVNKAIASLPSAKNVTATVKGNTVVLKDTVTIGSQTSSACSTFTGATLKNGATVIACP